MVRAPRQLLPPFVVALAAAVLLAGGATGTGTEERESRLYEVRHRLAGELLPLAQDLMGERGTATEHPGSNAILLVGPPEDIARTLRFLFMQDRALSTIVVHHTRKRLADIEAAGVEVRWKVEAGGVRIGTLVPPPEGDSFALKARGEWQREQLEGASQIRMLEGSPARIETGTALPYPSAGRDGGVAFVTAGAGFSGSARVLGNGRVRLALAPLLSRLGAEGVIHSTSSEAVLELAPGEVKLLGGIAEAASTRGSSLAPRRSRAEQDDDLVLLFRVEIE